MAYATQVAIPYSTGVPEDVVTNVWHHVWLGSGDPALINVQALQQAIRDFYVRIFDDNTVATFANYINPNGTRMKTYDLADPEPRVPIRDSLVAISGVQKDSNTKTPPEVACCLSYHTDYVGGVNRQSQRGRIYLGGLGDVCTTAGAGAVPPSFDSDFTSAVAGSATQATAAFLTEEWGWVVHSTKLNQDFAVAGGWVDNAFDTQRRRGTAATARTNWTD